MRVRYRPVGSNAEAGALTFGRGEGHSATVVEAGHRSMRTYYKQSYKPVNGAVQAGAARAHAAVRERRRARCARGRGARRAPRPLLSMATCPRRIARRRRRL